jgi:hypothetical protein
VRSGDVVEGNGDAAVEMYAHLRLGVYSLSAVSKASRTTA